MDATQVIKNIGICNDMGQWLSSGSVLVKGTLRSIEHHAFGLAIWLQSGELVLWRMSYDIAHAVVEWWLAIAVAMAA